MNLFIILFLFYYVYSAKVSTCDTEKCTSHTDIYNEYNNNNELSRLYLEDTYLSYYNIDPCKKYTSRTEYIKTLKENGIYCSGDWCIDGDYSCSGVGNQCWQVEHIIDKKNSIMSDKDYNMEIYGNIIMAYGKWNGQIGQRIWPVVKKEKSLVYGDIFSSAELNILKCSDIHYTNNTNDILDFDKETLIVSLCISIIINVILI